MFDPVSLTLFASYLGPAALGLLKKLANDRAESLAGKLVDKAVGLWKKDDLEEALERAYGACLESIGWHLLSWHLHLSTFSSLPTQP